MKAKPLFAVEPKEISDPELPAHVMAEKFILGAILLDNETIEGLDLSPDHFSLETHKMIYLAMLTLHDFRSGIDHVTLSNELQRTKNLGLVGVPYLSDLTLGMPRRPHIADYVAIVKEKSRLRDIITICIGAADRAWANDPAKEILDSLKIALEAIK